LKLPEFVDSRHMKVVRSPLPLKNIPLGTHFCWRLSRSQGGIVRPEGLIRLKILVTLSGIEPAICRLAAQYLNVPRHCHRGMGGIVNWTRCEKKCSEVEFQVKSWHLPRWIERNHATCQDVCGSKCEFRSLQMQMSNANHLNTMFANTR